MNGIKVVGVVDQWLRCPAALKIALTGAENAGAEVQLFSIRELNLLIFNPTMQDVPDRVHSFVETTHQAHGLIWCNPT